METKNIAAVILAGGKGTRMNAELAKVLHTIYGKPIVRYILDKLQKLGIEDKTVVVFYQADKVQEAVSNDHQVKFAIQEAALGTGNALQTGLSKVDPLSRIILVFNGDDSAFYSLETITKFIQSHQESNAIVSLMGVKKETERPLGKIFQDAKGNFEAVLEPTEYLSMDKRSDIVNCGAYIFDFAWLKDNIAKISLNPIKKEYYINDLPNLAEQQGLKVNIFTLQNPDEWIGVNTQEELEYANQKMKEFNN